MIRRADTRRRAVAPPARAPSDYLRAKLGRAPAPANDNPAPNSPRLVVFVLCLACAACIGVVLGL